MGSWSLGNGKGGHMPIMTLEIRGKHSHKSAQSCQITAETEDINANGPHRGQRKAACGTTRRRKEHYNQPEPGVPAHYTQ